MPELTMAAKAARAELARIIDDKQLRHILKHDSLYRFLIGTALNACALAPEDILEESAVRIFPGTLRAIARGEPESAPSLDVRMRLFRIGIRPLLSEPEDPAEIAARKELQQMRKAFLELLMSEEEFGENLKQRAFFIDAIQKAVEVCKLSVRELASHTRERAGNTTYETASELDINGWLKGMKIPRSTKERIEFFNRAVIPTLRRVLDE